METSQTYDVCWTSHATETFSHLARFHLADRYTDVTLIAGPCRFRAHRAVLAACSMFFERVLDQVSLESDTIPIRTAIVLKDVPADVLHFMVDFMYTGVAHLPPDRFNDFMALAENLEVRSLMCHVGEQNTTDCDPQSPQSSGYTVSTTEPPSNGSRVSDLVTEELLSNVTQKDPAEDVVIREMFDFDKMGDSHDSSDNSERDYLGDGGSSCIYSEESYPEDKEENIPKDVSKSTLEKVGASTWKGWIGASSSGAKSRVQSARCVYFCSVCGYRAPSPWHAKRHERTHSNKSSYPCPVCSQKFSDPDKLETHSIAVHGVKFARKIKMSRQEHSTADLD